MENQTIEQIKDLNVINVIEIPKKHFDNILIKSVMTNKEKRNLEKWLWKNESNEKISNKEWDKINKKIKKLKEKEEYFFSMYSLVRLIDKVIDRKESQQLDVTKIYISENTYKGMKEHDKKLLNILYKGLYNKKRIDNELGMLHLFSGFSVEKNLLDNKIYILEGVLKLPYYSL